MVSGNKNVTNPATKGKMANNIGGNQDARTSESTTNGATIDPTRAIIDENPIAAFLTTVGNNSEQYKYTTTNTIKLATTPTLANMTDVEPAGITAKIIRHAAQIKLKIITIDFLPITRRSGMATNVPRRVTLALAATLTKTFPLN